MQKLWTKLALVIIMLGLAIFSIVPPEKKLRLGKDLRGGVTLVYSVDIRPGDNAGQVLSSVIDVLKNRIDPNNLYEISMVPQGRDRIEITMPLPGDDVKRAKAEYEAAIAGLDAARWTPERVDSIMAMSAEERDREIAALAGGDAEAAGRLRALAQAYDHARHLRENYEEAERSGAEQSALAQLALQASEAAIEYEEALAGFAENTLTAEDVAQALRLSDQARSLYDEDTGERVEIPSPRSSALGRLRERYPEQRAQLDEILREFEEYESIRTMLDDPRDLERLLASSGVLSFRITVDPASDPDEQRLRDELRENGPRAARSDTMAWFKINKIENWYSSVAEMLALEADAARFFSSRGYVVEEYEGEYYMLCWDVRGSRLTPEFDRDWRVERASQGVDELGRPSINFEMDPRGASLLGALSEAHVGDRMAVLLDDEVYTAPNLNSRISRNGQIMGDFSSEELQYIIRVLNSGSLQNKLSPTPLSQVVIGPDLGLDNLVRSMQAGMIAAIICAVFLVGYYFWCGAIALAALAINVLLLLAAMAIGAAPLSIPGIAGIILTFGMAVDANVLVYERMREEIAENKADLPTAVRLGYSRAMSAIVDGNLTNLIVCLVLYAVGTPEIRGFGVTMSIGVVTTLISQLFVTRIIFELGIRFGRWRRTTMLPLVVPAIQRLFSLSVRWYRMRFAFWTVSALLVLASVGLALSRGPDMFDHEFRGGTAFTLELKENPDGTHETLTRQQVEDRLDAIVANGAPELAPLRSASVVVIDPEPGGVTSSTFQVKSLLTDARAARDAVIEAFGDKIESRPALRFEGWNAARGVQAPAFPILSEQLSEVVGRPGVERSVTDWRGGLAILLENIQPPVSARQIDDRLANERLRAGPDDARERDSEIIVIEGTPDAVTSAVVLVRDPHLSYLQDEELWNARMLEVEWVMARAALTEAQATLSVQAFSPAIARTFVAQAILAIVLSMLLLVIYVWVRFGSARFGLAAILATVHDACIALGLLAVAEIVYDTLPQFAQPLGILPFKVDLTVIAALLTILGYSINDKIVVLDRIRENRGRLSYVSPEMVDLSINQTLSRTVMTGTTTILSTMALYLVGGEAVRAFAFVLLFGIIVGTISSVTIAAPLVAYGKKPDGFRNLPPPGA
ncbi:MAG TPA: protein translocase subunit SecD [Phycisphaerales bacterium]|nr:protein translocase subunit SecD [Phycisphaerales bacterium]